MAYSNWSIVIPCLALAGLVGCGGSDKNTQPQTPAGQGSDTTMTTGAAASGSNTGASGTTGATGTTDTSSMGGATAGSTGTTGAGTTGSGMGGGMGTTGAAGGSTGSMGGGTGTTTGTGGDTSGTTTLSDDQIAAVTEAADNGEVEQAKEALKKAKSAKVKQFAQHMVTDHSANLKKTQALLKKNHMTASDNDLSRQIQSDGRQMMSQMQSATGGDFDKQYIDAQVKEHQQLLDNLDNKLIPNAKNAEMKAELQKTRDTVADHLKQAKDIQASLK